MSEIVVQGARVHNLKNVHIRLPHGKLIVITGVSGSGKSSLAFDTIYAEAQRRFVETLSSYARQFMGTLERPDVDFIEGLSPSISIEQKTVSKNPRSTVGTITEVYDFLRLLYARVGEKEHAASLGGLQVQTEQDIVSAILSFPKQCLIQILAPVVSGRKGHYRELFEALRKKGFIKVRVDGVVMDIEKNMRLDRYKIHDIDIWIDQMAVNRENEMRIKSAVNTGLKNSFNNVSVTCEQIFPEKRVHQFVKVTSEMGTRSAMMYAPNMFSFNSKYGACTSCEGLGEELGISEELVVSGPGLSLVDGAIAPLGKQSDSGMWRKVKAVCEQFSISLSSPFESLSIEHQKLILYGSAKEKFFIKVTHGRESFTLPIVFDGIVGFLREEIEQSSSVQRKRWAESFLKATVCKDCNGARLKPESLELKINGKNISEVASFSILECKAFMNTLKTALPTRVQKIASPILTEITKRLNFLTNVGLDYLTLNRSSTTISGGEAQRIRLAAQLGSQLTGVLYILDEPSIGLHQRDNESLIKSLEMLRDMDNTIIVVEHDKEIMKRADWIVDIGPGAGEHGGQVVAEGTYSTLIQSKTSATGHYLSNARRIDVPRVRRQGSGNFIRIEGCIGHNLKSVTLSIPLGTFVVVTGVSGSGKSSLINETLYPILAAHVYNSRYRTLPYTKTSGLEHIDKVINVDQSPIGRTPRSNPATYTGVFTHIRNLFASFPESKLRGYKEGRFSFNVKGGRCSDCEGDGVKRIEMNFLPDVFVTCETCRGRRYNRETLQDMSSWVNLQPALSGGEAQRIKLATELAKRQTGKTVYVFDEPTTGLHFQDIEALLSTLHQLAEAKNTVIVIEHNLDVIKQADWLIDVGPGSGMAGETIAEDLKIAMRAGNKVELEVIRGIRKALQEKEITIRQNGVGKLSEEQETQVLLSLAKQRRDSIEQFKTGQRDDLAEKEATELSILMRYLPQQLSEDDVRKKIMELITTLGVTSSKDFGKLMGAATKALKGQADGNIIQKIAKELLQ
ncbi:hypothetical protein CHS0354_023730 [Potamilus streckersoni]|uniref:ABC transporter domain-containing protein n=1 Tax=Potamilus streckersoni TaxID=2493646 RepID=A0AAE0VLD5_9BIVA|nr:hypothetical protein CHS0354_023730 [Potamilus streckersoni]